MYLQCITDIHESIYIYIPRCLMIFVNFHRYPPHMHVHTYIHTYICVCANFYILYLHRYRFLDIFVFTFANMCLCIYMCKSSFSLRAFFNYI